MNSGAMTNGSPRSDILPVAARLFLICAVAAVILGLINTVTEPVIRQRKVLELEQALARLTPQGARADAGVEVAGDPVVRAWYPLVRDGGTVGAILDLRGTGYGGEMRILARFGADGEVQDVALMDNQETPGLGKKAESPAYMEKFTATGGAGEPIPVRKDMLSRGEADAVTGATITFIGVARALQEGSRFVQEGR